MTEQLRGWAARDHHEYREPARKPIQIVIDPKSLNRAAAVLGLSGLVGIGAVGHGIYSDHLKEQEIRELHRQEAAKEELEASKDLRMTSDKIRTFTFDLKDGSELTTAAKKYLESIKEPSEGLIQLMIIAKPLKDRHGISIGASELTLIFVNEDGSRVAAADLGRVTYPSRYSAYFSATKANREEDRKLFTALGNAIHSQ